MTTWRYKNIDKMPQWVKEQSSIREGLEHIIFMHTMEGEKPAVVGDYIHMDSRGHVHVYKENPKKILFFKIFNR